MRHRLYAIICFLCCVGLNGFDYEFRRTSYAGIDAFEAALLGDVYFFGKGGEVDYQSAREWYEIAAERGVPEAQNNLGTDLSAWFRGTSRLATGCILV